MGIEEQHLDVLQNLEAVVAEVFRDRPELCDYDVQRIYETLIRHYQAQRMGRQADLLANPSELESSLLDKLLAVCQWWLGKAPVPATAHLENEFAPVSDEVLLLCLKRLIRSVKGWTNRGGRQGYVTFIEKYV